MEASEVMLQSEISAVPAGRGATFATRRDLAIELVRHQVRRTYAGTLLGSAWAVIQPLLLMGGYVFLFTVLRVPKQLPEGSLGVLGIVLSGLVPWLFFSRSITGALNAYPGHAALIRQLNFPLGVVPFVTVGTALIPFLVGLVALAILAALAGWLSWAMLLLLPAALLIALFMVASASLVAPFGVLVRDLRALVPPLMRIALFLTPVLYLPDRVPPAAAFLPYLNPASYFIAMVRYAVFERSDVSVIGPAEDWAVAIGVTIVVLALAVANRNFAQRRVVDSL
jgi:ABC-type polysaccharide/polyol phosphate export permease